MTIPDKVTASDRNAHIQTKIREFYDRLHAVSLLEVVEHLAPERITDEQGAKVYLDCPHHSSQSGRSLLLDLDKNLWNCFGCSVGGDVIHLVEFLMFGVVTKVGERS